MMSPSSQQASSALRRKRRHDEKLPSTTSKTEEDDVHFRDSSSLSFRSSFESRSFGSRSRSHSPDLPYEESVTSHSLMRLTSREKARCHNQLSLTANKLRFQDLPLLGRHEEIQILTGSLERISQLKGEHTRRELILIRGVSGCGKTALALQLTAPTRRLGGVLARGKFSSTGGLFEAIAAACRELCGQLMHYEGAKEILGIMRHELGEDGIRLLSSVFPEIVELAKVADTHENDPVGAKSGLFQAFCGFFRILASHMGPLVVFLDDLQNANAASMELLEAILTDKHRCNMPDDHVVQKDEDDDVEECKPQHQTENPPTPSPQLLVVGVYREDEVATNPALSEFLEKMNASAEKATTKTDAPAEKTTTTDATAGRNNPEEEALHITQIALGSLPVPIVHRLLMELLSLDDSNPQVQDGSLMELAKICHKRSNGIPFHLSQFLQLLREKQLLEFHLGFYTWTYDVEKIAESTQATQNVVDLLTHRLTSLLPQDLGNRVAAVACLGSTFQKCHLEAIWGELAAEVTASSAEQPNEDTTKDMDLESFLSLVQEEGLIESMSLQTDSMPEATPTSGGSETYRWVHDKIQESALLLVKQEQLPPLKRTVGTILHDKLLPDQVEAQLVSIVSLMNEGSEDDIQQDESHWLQMADLNHRAARKALASSAFESAAKHAAQGITYLEHVEDRWSSHYELSLGLYSTAAEAEHLTGDADMLMNHYMVVTAHTKDKPVLDSVRVYVAMLQYKSGAMQHEQAVDQLVALLKRLGVRFPKGKVGRVSGMLGSIFKLKRKMKKMGPIDDYVSRSPVMEDKTQIAVMKLLSLLSKYAYRSVKQKALMPLAVIESIRFTFKHGACEYSPPAFAALGIVYSGILKDFETGGRCGEVALRLLERLECKTTVARTIMYSVCFTRCWVDPIANTWAPLVRAYKEGLASGDSENSVVAIWASISLGLLSGMSLKQMESDCRSYVDQMLYFSRINMLNLTLFYWLAIVKLMGAGDDLPPLHGIDASMQLGDLLSQFTDPTQVGVIRSLQCMVAVVLGNFEDGAKIAMDVGDNYSKTNPSHFSIMPETFSRALCLYAIARKEGKRGAHKREARRVHKTITTWTKGGNPNVLHYENFLKAEAAALEGRNDAAEGFYQSSIVLASRGGFTNTAALANERYAEFLLEVRKSPIEASYKFEEAIKLYNDWGATTKAESLLNTHSHLWEQDQPDQIMLPLTS